MSRQYQEFLELNNEYLKQNGERINFERFATKKLYGHQIELGQFKHVSPETAKNIGQITLSRVSLTDFMNDVDFKQSFPLDIFDSVYHDNWDELSLMAFYPKKFFTADPRSNLIQGLDRKYVQTSYGSADGLGNDKRVIYDVAYIEEVGRKVETIQVESGTEIPAIYNKQWGYYLDDLTHLNADIVEFRGISHYFDGDDELVPKSKLGPYAIREVSINTPLFTSSDHHYKHTYMTDKLIPSVHIGVVPSEHSDELISVTIPANGQPTFYNSGLWHKLPWLPNLPASHHLLKEVSRELSANL